MTRLLDKLRTTIERIIGQFNDSNALRNKLPWYWDLYDLFEYIDP